MVNLGQRIITDGIIDREIAAESIGDPTEKACGGVLGKQIPAFVGADADVGVAEYGGGNQDGGARREADYELEVPEDQMAAKVGVEDAKRRDRAPAPRKVERVDVGEGDSGWAEIERSGSKGRYREVAVRWRAELF
jgi:hypothetical protein